MSEKTAFKVSSDLAEGVLRMAPGAQMHDVQTMARFRQAMWAEADKFAAANLPFDVLADLRASPVESQIGGEHIRETISGLRERGHRRSANIVASVIKKLQVARVAQSHEVKFFETEEDALAWLAEMRAS